MKKISFFAALVSAIVSFTACTDEDVYNQNAEAALNKRTVSGVNATFANNQGFSLTQDGCMAATAFNAGNKTSRSGEYDNVKEFTYIGSSPLISGATAEKLAKNVFMKDFPNGRDNSTAAHPDLKELAFDFLYVSNGEPFDVYPLYSHAGYIDDIGIYYIDDKGDAHITDVSFPTIKKTSGGDQTRIWSMADNGWLKKSYSTRNGQRFANEDVDTYNQNGTGFRFVMPKGWKFGLWISNDQDKKKYSESARHKRGDKVEKQVATYSYEMDGNTYNLIGFEDIFYNNSDKDYNDICMMITPKQTVIPTGQVLVRWLTEDGEDLDPIEYSGEMKTGESYTGKAKEFSGYELLDPTHTEETKVVNEYNKDNIIVFVYKRKAVDYAVICQCMDCNRIIDVKKFSGHVGDRIYSTDHLPQFEGHGLVGASASYIILEEGQSNRITLLYRHTESSFTVKYLEEGTGKAVHEPSVLNNIKIGTKYKVDELSIDGYTCTNPGKQEITIDRDPNKNIVTYYYKKNSVDPTPIVPIVDNSIKVIFGSLDENLICTSDDFCIKYNQHEMEYAQYGGSSLVELKLEKGKPIAITIPDITAWKNGEKTYWTSISDDIEQAVFDLRLYNCRNEQDETISAEALKAMLFENHILKPDGYSVDVDKHISADNYGKKGVHITIIVNRIKQNK